MFLKLLKFLYPETANKLTIMALRHGFGPKIKQRDSDILFFGRMLPNRVGLAGGADRRAIALDGWRNMGFGFVEAGSVTLHPRAGNPKPRVWRMKDNQSLVNWMGFAGLGLDDFAKNLKEFRTTKSGQTYCVGVSLASPAGKADEFYQMASKLAGDADFFTLNVSCPNVTDHAASALQDMLEQLREAKRGAGQTPVVVKLGPTDNMDALKITVDEFVKAGANGFIACNTAPFALQNLLGHHKPDPWPIHNEQKVGGYSGPDLFPISLKMVRTIRDNVPSGMPVIGVGGIDSVEKAKEIIAAGATAIQLYTALTYQGPELIKKLQIVR